MPGCRSWLSLGSVPQSPHSTHSNEDRASLPDLAGHTQSCQPIAVAHFQFCHSLHCSPKFHLNLFWIEYSISVKIEKNHYLNFFTAINWLWLVHYVNWQRDYNARLAAVIDREESKSAVIGGAPYLHEASAAMGYLAPIVVRETRISKLSIKETRKYRTFCVDEN